MSGVPNTTVDSEEDLSDDTLKIVIESPNSKRKSSTPLLDDNEKLIIESVERELEETLEEKAAKRKLNANHVKNILRQVVTNEDVIAFVRHAENPEEESDEPVTVYEPKLTRAKAKELSTTVIPAVPWPTPKKASEVHVLFSEELQEDSSGDEYVPGEESEDERDSSVASDVDTLSQPPPTPPIPPKSPELPEQTTWDGVFKVPPVKTKAAKNDEENTQTNEEANIALRTRSKLCLSSTPLEVIEEAFIPPDITTDMYDTVCDDEDWEDFLKKFTKPLNEVIIPAEDEDHDPEYNILADEEIEKVDKEELRVDKAVKVSRKELNALMAELFEFADIYSNLEAKDKQQIEVVANTDVTKDISEKPAENTQTQQNNEVPCEIPVHQEVVQDPIIIERHHILLLEQQLRQHVQILTQNFILTYRHPELHQHSAQIKEYLLNFKYLSEGKIASIFNTVNLQEALKLIKEWETLYDSESDAVKAAKLHVERVIAESIQYKNSGTSYIVTFPPLVMETISKSTVFLYPSLLPRIPFKSPRWFANNTSYTDSENRLIALGMEQFVPIVSQDKRNMNYNGSVKMQVVASYIQQYMMPFRDYEKIFRHIRLTKQKRSYQNPINYYIENKRAPPVVHYVQSIDPSNILPPCKRPANDLPYQWQQYIFPTVYIPVTNTTATTSTSVLKPQVYPRGSSQRTLLPDGPVLTPIRTKLLCNGFSEKNSSSGRQLITSTPINSNKGGSNNTTVKKTILFTAHSNHNISSRKNETPISKFLLCIKKVCPVEKYLELSQYLSIHLTNPLADEESHIDINMLPSMPGLCTPIKQFPKSRGDEAESTADNTKVSNAGQAELFNNKPADIEIKESSTCSQTRIEKTILDVSIQGSQQDSPETYKSPQHKSNESSDETLTSLNNTESCNEESNFDLYSNAEKVNEKDNLEDINALMVASSTVKPAAKKDLSAAEKKLAKQRREFLTNLALAAPEDPEVEKQKDEMFALAYYDKMRETLELEDYHKIMQILNDHEGDAIDLYKKVDAIFRPKYEELADEFLLFLRDREAEAVGQLIPWLQMNTRVKFLRKLEIYFKDQPAQLRKILKSLTDLAESVDVTMEKIKTTLLPLLKGNALLTDLFLQNFLSERPPASLMDGPYETIDITKEMAKSDDEVPYETIVVPDAQDKYGSMTCMCSCHKIEDPEFKSRSRHCIPCGTKFVQGKVYIQTGRGLRPAIVSFLTSPNKDHNVRLNGKTSTQTTSTRKKRSDTSPSKQVTSPAKDNADEESDEDDKKRKCSKRTSRKRKVKQADKATVSKSQRNFSKRSAIKNCYIGKPGSSPRKSNTSARKRSIPCRRSKLKENESENTTSETKVDADLSEEKDRIEEPMDWDPAAQTECTDLKPSSPEQATAESESEFCEESSQDNCDSDSNTSISSATHSQSDAGEEITWKREEDKIILETFQSENDKEYAFRLIARHLKNRSVSQIRSRFQTLMKLLLEQLDERTLE